MGERPRPEHAEKPAFEHVVIRNEEVRQLLRDRVGALVEHAKATRADSLVFLDKSARPIAWLFRDLWRQATPDEPVPACRFVNIGRLEEPHLPEFPRKQRKTYGRGAVDAVGVAFGPQFDGKRVLIVDEVVVSGSTLQSAMSVFKEAFPNAKFEPVHIATVREIGNLPWMDMPGATSVLELDEGLFTHSLTPDTVDRARRALVRKFEASTTPALDLHYRALVREGKRMIDRAASEFFRAEVGVALPRSVRGLVEQARRQFSTVSDPDGRIDEERPVTELVAGITGTANTLRDLLEQINAFLLAQKKPPANAAELRAVAKAASRFSRELDIFEGQGVDMAAVQFAAQSTLYRDPVRLVEMGNQLRAEMAEIAKMPPTPRDAST